MAAALIIVALVCFYMSYRLFVWAFPVQAAEKLEQVENALISTVYISDVKVSKWLFLGSLLGHLKVFSSHANSIQKNHIRSLSSQLMSRLQEEQRKTDYVFCEVIFERAKLEVSEMTLSDLNPASIMKKVNKFSETFDNWVNLLKTVETKSSKVSQTISSLYQNRDPDVQQAASAFQDAFSTIRNCFSNLGINNIEGLLGLSKKLDELQEILDQVSQPVTPRTEGWIDYYALLEVQPFADFEIIKSAYRKKLTQNHPDTKLSEIEKIVDEDVKNEINKVYNKRVMLLAEAFGILKDAVARKQYDDEYAKRKGVQNESS